MTGAILNDFCAEKMAFEHQKLAPENKPTLSWRLVQKQERESLNRIESHGDAIWLSLNLSYLK